ncbi:MAG: hypothetical protein EON52_09560 [Actinomycetales bacterium]|nr:MAG: hypothetical protein EON52_09560 [Actinomycetales bacterium]
MGRRMPRASSARDRREEAAFTPNSEPRAPGRRQPKHGRDDVICIRPRGRGRCCHARCMSTRARLGGWFRRTGSEVLGWILVPVGIILMPAPGPGTLVLVAGVALLAPHHAWARRILEPLRRNAIEAARYGVATIPRIVVSALGGVWLVVLAYVWWRSPEIPEFDVLGVGFGPRLPAAGWVTALGLLASALAAWGLLVYSVLRWRD